MMPASRAALVLTGLLGACPWLWGCAPRAPLEGPPPPPRVEAPKDAGELSLAADAAPVSRGDAWESAAVDRAVSDALAEKKLPGCVVLIGTRNETLLRRAYGSRSVEPAVEAMDAETIFDLASLTKPIATSLAVHILADRKALSLDDKVSRHLSAFAVPGKDKITVRHLLLHTSGLPAVAPRATFARGGADMLQKIAQLSAAPAGSRFRYSDVGYVVLSELVAKVAGRPLDVFAREAIFEPLGMRNTGFRPSSGDAARIAPTERKDGVPLRGEVHDPIAASLGGVAGNAGLFSTVDDLGRFARMLLARGNAGASSGAGPGAIGSVPPSKVSPGGRILSEAAFHEWTAVHDVPAGLRTPGWDVRTTLSLNRAENLSPRAFGHGGYTGTGLWVDPTRDLFLVFLSNRVHPDGKGNAAALVAKIGGVAVDAVDASLGRSPRSKLCVGPTEPGIDVLMGEGMRRFAGKRVALLTNAGARTRSGETTLAALKRALGDRLTLLFVPEHGFGADGEGKIADGVVEGVPARSLFGARLSPDDAAFGLFDVLIVDLPDVGLRFFTYAATLHRVMRAASARGKEVLVLDRPNPLGALDVDGPTDVPAGSFVHHHPIPLVHQMTIGELSWLLDAEEHLGTALDVVPMRGYRPRGWFDESGLTWSPPSPNLLTFDAALAYAATALIEGTNVSVGRGTEEPFQVLGAPWFKPELVLRELAQAKLAGVQFAAATFTPAAAARFANQPLPALRMRVTDRASYRPVRVGLAIATALRSVHRGEWDVTKLDDMVGSKVATAVVEGKALSAVESVYAKDLASFTRRRAKYLAYGGCENDARLGTGTGASANGAKE